MKKTRRIFTALALGIGFASAQAEQPTLKVCTAEDEMPYSNKLGEGFENRLAQHVAEQMGRKLEIVIWSDPRYFIRDYLDKGLCDVVMGVDASDPRLLTTVPYYRSGYVFISREKDGLDLQDWNSPALKTAQRIAFAPGTPAETMLRAIGRYNDLFNYQQELVGFKSRRNQYVKYDNQKLVNEVASGKAEIAILWGPAAARYVKASATPLTMTLIPDNANRADGEKVGFHYSTSIGVRKGETALLEQLNKIIKQQQDEIGELLEAEGIPLLDEPETRLSMN
ncbi:MAG: methanol oxidation system protein MoxJ [Methylomonas sp.]|nr:methanol oxidation system protein MoxJ [Methylomonas sp.]PPD20221.1 MAG: methanol oxidation system protein MoxJ [Methylomonas sp.]PPD26260.1 MAG: methanol oxidation system protein MoxJ [Methylomonas sp.]PPD37977.1 MAG: methanol oxidation system protein MoxJ [Methylomonas sp.]PPD40359.1 MAG: methanol oxidation system protein MoxJ [Methylomonas sp.]